MFQSLHLAEFGARFNLIIIRHVFLILVCHFFGAVEDLFVFLQRQLSRHKKHSRDMREPVAEFCFILSSHSFSN